MNLGAVWSGSLSALQSYIKEVFKMTKLKEKVSPKEKKSLFKIKEEYEEIIEEILESEGEISESLFNRLEEIDDDFTAKSENYVYVIKKTETENEYIDTEIKRLQTRKRRNSNLIGRLKYSLMESLESIDKIKIQTPLYTIRIQNNPPAIRIVDENIIPDDFKEERISVYINKKAILEALKSGEEVNGAKITVGKSLRIS